jgi:transposase
LLEPLEFLDLRSLLEFRSELPFLSDLDLLSESALATRVGVGAITVTGFATAITETALHLLPAGAADAKEAKVAKTGF